MRKEGTSNQETGEKPTMATDKHVAIYVRVSTGTQDTRSQRPDLERHIAGLPEGTTVRWYTDKFSGKTMERPGWQKLDEAIKRGEVRSIVCWRLDRLGRTAKGLTALFSLLQERKVNLVSLKDGLDLSTAAGRLMAHVLASVAQYETEIRAERVLAGQAAARAAGKTWGGSKAGIPRTVTAEQIEIVRGMNAEGESKSAMMRATKLSRPTVYRILKQYL
jgi:DNA invertase Pin-like site-specific DNA recombinase